MMNVTDTVDSHDGSRKLPRDHAGLPCSYPSTMRSGLCCDGGYRHAKEEFQLSLRLTVPSRSTYLVSRHFSMSFDSDKLVQLSCHNFISPVSECESHTGLQTPRYYFAAENNRERF